MVNKNGLHFLGNEEEEEGVGYPWLRTSGKEVRGDAIGGLLGMYTECAYTVPGEDKKQERTMLAKAQH